MSSTVIDDHLHTVADQAPAAFTWDYDKGARPKLNKLYEKAKGAQWNAETDLDWSTDVDVEKLAHLSLQTMRPVIDSVGVAGTPLAGWGDEEWLAYGVESQRYMLSQFLHGEQGALLCTAKIVETVPWVDAKYYAATQVMDEARHVEVFAKYIDTKLDGGYPINSQLGLLLDDIIVDSRWDMTYLGMQIMVEGLALAAFGLMQQFTPDPLLRQLLRYVMADEARHVAFGVLSLAEVYDSLSAAEIRERQEFAYDAAVRMKDRLMQADVFVRLGVDRDEILPLLRHNPGQILFQQMLFAKIVPNCRKLGLLDAAGGWLRQRFAELDVLQFEHATDTSDEVLATN